MTSLKGIGTALLVSRSHEMLEELFAKGGVNLEDWAREKSNPGWLADGEGACDPLSVTFQHKIDWVDRLMKKF